MSTHHRKGRAWRRHDTARLKKVRANHSSVSLWPPCDPAVYRRALGMAVNTAARCSCWMCRNPRRDGKDRLTLQERRMDAAQREALAGEPEAGPRFQD